MHIAKIKLYPRLVIGFVLFVLSGALFGKLLISVVFPDSNKNLTVNTNKPATSTTSSEFLNFAHPNGSYSFNFPSNWNLLYLTPEENVLMVAPEEKIDAVKSMQEGFGTSSELVITITQSTNKPKISSDKLWDITTKESITLDGKSGTKNLIQVLKDMSGFKQDAKLIDIVVPHQKTYLNIQLLDAAHEDTFNKILESFKLMEFMEATPSPTPSTLPSQSPQASAAASPL